METFKYIYEKVTSMNYDGGLQLEMDWIKCPICGGKTHNKVREDTEMKKFPLFCPKCKQETLIDVKNLTVTVHKEISEE